MRGILLNVQYFCFCFPITVYSQPKPVYKGHSREPENVYALFINAETVTALYTLWFAI